MQDNKRGRTAALAILLLMAAFTAGLYHLMHLRFEMGDVYPEYSSFRPDPLGTQALYDSISLMDGMEAMRNVKAPIAREFEKLKTPGQTTVIYIAQSAKALDFMPKGQAQALSTFAATGGRVVLAVQPEHAHEDQIIDRLIKKRMEKSCKDEKEKASHNEQGGEDATPEHVQDGEETGAPPEGMPPAEASPDAPQQDVPAPEGVDHEGEGAKEDDSGETDCLIRQGDFASLIRKKPFYRNFGVMVDIANTSNFGYIPEAGPVAVRTVDDEALPPALTWHSASFATGASGSWDVAYSLNTRPVILSRNLGKGSVVLITDAYHLSNEALMMERQPGILAWLIGADITKVIFEEAHLGVRESEGVASLGRKYRLHWLALALLALALLFVWQNATSLVPPGAYARGAGQASVMSGKDYVSGMVSLMRRNVPASALMSTCVEQWRRSFARKRMRLKDEAARIEAVLNHDTSGGKDRTGPVKMYTEITKIIAERKH